jgi:hypothetical protein
MDEPRQHDRGASLTDAVRQFRRAARLAAADPLRLMPLDALVQLAPLCAPVTDLINLEPFERLRRGVAAAPAAPRRDPQRTRQQPFAGTGGDVRQKPAAAASAPTPQVVTRNATPPDARREPSSSPAPVRFTGEPLRRDNASATTLADRRAALRRRTIGAGSPAGSASPFAAQTAASSRSTVSDDAREIGVGARARQGVNEEIGGQPLRRGPLPVDPVLLDRDSLISASNDPGASAALDRATHEALFADDARTASAPTDESSGRPPHAAVEIPAARNMPAAALRSGPNDLEPLAVAYARSSPVPEVSPQGARRPQPDIGAAQRGRAWEPHGESEAADALFEALYRDGVDLPWP